MADLNKINEYTVNTVYWFQKRFQASHFLPLSFAMQKQQYKTEAYTEAATGVVGRKQENVCVGVSFK